MNQSSPNRTGFRWRSLLQFRLRTLLALLVLSALAMGAARWRMEQYAFRAMMTEAVLTKAVHVGSQPGTPWILARFADPTTFRDVTHLSLHGVRTVDDSDLALLRFLPELRRLSLHGAGISDNGAVHLAQLKSLQALSLKSTAITDKTIEQLQDLTQLELLQLSNCSDIGPALAKLGNLTRLQTFEAFGANVNEQQLAWLAGCQNLRILDIMQTLVKDPSSLLAKVSHLRELSVGGWQLERLELAGAADLTKLRVATRGAALKLVDLPRLQSLQVVSPSECAKQRSNGRPFTVSRIELKNLPSLTGLSLPLAREVSIVDAAKLAELRLSVGSLSGQDLQETMDEDCRLQGLPSLKLLQIRMNGSKLPATLGNLDALQNLSVANATRSDVGSAPLRVDAITQLEQLNEVVLRDVVVDQETLGALPPSVRSLTIVRGLLTADALQGLGRLVELNSLEIIEPRILHGHLLAPLTAPTRDAPRIERRVALPEPLPTLPRLAQLRVVQTAQRPWPARVFLGDLAGKPSLTDLTFTGLNIEVADLESIAGLKYLTNLYLSDESASWSVAKCEALRGARSLVNLGIAYQDGPATPSEQELRRILTVGRDPLTFLLQLRAVSPPPASPRAQLR